MADTVVKKVAYFAMDIQNRPGEGARILSELAAAGANLLAFSGFPNGRKAQLDFIPEDIAAFKKAAKAAKIKVRAQKTVFLIQGKDRKGAVAAVLQKLAEKKINIIAVDAACSGGGRFGAILWVAPKDVSKAGKALGAV